MFTPVPVLWSRVLRSHTAVARANALAATRAVRARRAEADEIERYFAERQDVNAAGDSLIS